MASPAAPAPVPTLKEKIPQASYLSGVTSLVQPLVSPFADTYGSFADWRARLGLSNPGTVEALGREVKTTHLTNYTFDGARADLTKGLSINPAFQVTHSFALGSQTQPSSYNFGAVFANKDIFMQGGVDHDGNVSGRLNQGWSASDITKVQAQLSQTPGHSMVQFEHDHVGDDYSLTFKAINPSPIDFTGIYITSYLQSLSKTFSLGFENLNQRPQPGISESSTSLLAKLTSLPTPADPLTGAPAYHKWISTLQVQPAGVLQATYHQKLAPNVDLGAELSVVTAQGRREATATVGVKYDFRMSTFRGQVDSNGKVGALLEQRFTPAFAFLVTGEIDHWKNTAKVGMGVMVESTSLTPEEMGMVPGQTM